MAVSEYAVVKVRFTTGVAHALVGVATPVCFIMRFSQDYGGKMTLPEMRVELEELQDKRRNLEKKIEDVNKQYKIGMWGILLGVPLLFAYGFGLLLIVAGGLAAVTNVSKRNATNKELDTTNASIKELRRKIAEIEANQS